MRAPGPAQGVIEVWLVALPERPAPRDVALLDPDETALAAQFSSPLLAARFIGGRAAVRRILGSALDVPAAELRFERERCPQCGEHSPHGHGRPRVALPGCPLRFSLSRAGSLAAVAIADRCDVGVDIEPIRPANLAALGPNTLSPAERTRLEQAPPPERLAQFFRAWCRKEALTKAVGIGIATDLCAIDALAHLPGPVRMDLRLEPRSIVHGPAGRDERASAWQVHDLSGLDGLAGAVAWPLDVPRELVVRRQRTLTASLAAAD